MVEVPSIVSQLRYEEEQGILNSENIYDNISKDNSSFQRSDSYDDIVLETIKKISTIEHTPLFVQDGNYNIKWMNPSLKNKLSIGDDPTDQRCYQQLFNRSEPCTLCSVKEAIEKKEPIEKKIEIKPFGIQYIRSLPLFINNKFHGVIQTIDDINNNSMSDETSNVDIIQDQQTIIENAALGIIVLDENLKHITINPSFSGMTGYAKSDLDTDTECPLYWPKKFANEIRIEIQRLQKKGQIKLQTYFQRKDKSIFPVSIVGSTFIEKNTKKEHIILIVDDITKTKATERELKISQLLLMSLVENLEKKVQDRTKKIEQLLKQKNEFINQLGHDLKNPIGPIVNLTPVLLRHEEDPNKKKMLEVILRNVNHMKNLVTKTIELARLNSGNIRLHFEQLNLKHALNDSIVRNKHILEENSVEIIDNLSEEFCVIADKLRIEELFDNIISNSVKYSNDEGTIIINGSSTDTTVTISIKDHGIGMSQEQIDCVFDEFYKADSSRHDFKSSGLGTSIIKRIVEKHGGHIKIESEGIGKGTTVTFTIQKNPPAYLKRKNEEIEKNAK